jgi:hypothetical protein
MPADEPIPQEAKTQDLKWSFSFGPALDKLFSADVRLILCSMVLLSMWICACHCVGQRMHKPSFSSLAPAKDPDDAPSEHSTEATSDDNESNSNSMASPSELYSAMPQPVPELEPARRGKGICCCSAGLSKLIKLPMKGQDSRWEGSLLHSNTDSAVSDAGAEWWGDCMQERVQLPPPSCIVNGRPDFSGTWKCARVEGELEELLVDYGIGYVMRSTAATYAYGAGRITRICEQEGDQMRYKEDNVIGMVDVDFAVPVKDYNMGQHLASFHWDEQQPHVLVCTGKDLEKCKPSTWSVSFQYFVDENTFHIDSRSTRNHTARWIYERQCET